MTDTNKEKDDQKFNETLKRMLETPPKPHKERKTEDYDADEANSD